MDCFVGYRKDYCITRKIDGYPVAKHISMAESYGHIAIPSVSSVIFGAGLLANNVQAIS